MAGSWLAALIGRRWIMVILEDGARADGFEFQFVCHFESKHEGQKCKRI
jgi:hypothetical protein